jgi:hypothetical protein
VVEVAFDAVRQAHGPDGSTSLTVPEHGRRERSRRAAGERELTDSRFQMTNKPRSAHGEDFAAAGARQKRFDAAGGNWGGTRPQGMRT